MSQPEARAPSRRSRAASGLRADLAAVPLTVVAGAVVLAVSVLWGLVKLPQAAQGVLGPGGRAQGQGLAVLAVVLMTLPSLVEITALVAIVLRRGWCWIPLTLLVLWYGVTLAASGVGGPVAPLLLTLVPLVLVLLRPSRAWFRSRLARRDA
jgi:hypothetical protein